MTATDMWGLIFNLLCFYIFIISTKTLQPLMCIYLADNK